MRRPCFELVVLAGILLIGGEAAAQKRRGLADEKPSRPEDENVNEEQGVGIVPLGATVQGYVIRGFYNRITFEAVQGTVVEFGLTTRRRGAVLTAELIGPQRNLRADFTAPEGADGRALELTGYTLGATGTWSIRFGFQGEENGDYQLRTDAAHPQGFTAAATLEAGGTWSCELHGMLGRKLGRLEFLLPDATADVRLELFDPHGAPVPLEDHVQRTTFGRRIRVTGVPLDSNAAYRLILHETGGAAAAFPVEVEFENPPLSRKRMKV